MSPRSTADSVVRAIINEADQIIAARNPAARSTAATLVRDLLEADRRLARRLALAGAEDERFSVALAAAYQRQARIVAAHLTARLQGTVLDYTRGAARAGLAHTAQALARLEHAFTGVVISTPVRAASALTGPLASRLAQSATSVDRYGTNMVRAIEREMRVGLLEGLTHGQMVDRICGLRGPRGTVSMRAIEIQPGLVVRLAEHEIPEGLFIRHRSWAWRIVRTEGSHAFNSARIEAMFEQRQELPDLQKKILAFFDARTAYDSVAVHGQIRELNDSFVDGAGRVYLMPPARPNDRETVIPWRPHWDETGTTSAVPPSMVRRAETAAHPGTRPRERQVRLRARRGRAA